MLALIRTCWPPISNGWRSAVQRALGKQAGMGGLAAALLDDRELVAAEPGDQLIAAHHRRSRCAASISNSSPAGWPCMSLTALNPSRSMQSTAIGAFCSCRLVDAAGEMLGEDGAVGEAGQRVVIGEMGDPRRRLLALADIAHRQHLAFGPAPVQPAQQHLDVMLAAVRAEQPAFARDRFAARGDRERIEAGEELERVAGMAVSSA